MNWQLIEIYWGTVDYNPGVRPANPGLRTYIAKSKLTSWGNGKWIDIYTLGVL